MTGSPAIHGASEAAYAVLDEIAGKYAQILSSAPRFTGAIASNSRRSSERSDALQLIQDRAF